MCTVTYAPLRGGGHVITSNRDELDLRHGRPAGPWLHDGAVLLSPKDATTGTTWIAASSLGRSVCLFNGTEGTMYFHEQPIRSRGEVLLEAATAPDGLMGLVRSDLNRVQPFTLISAAHHTLWMLRWDGLERCVCTLDTERPQLWSSPTLYDARVRAERQQHFNQLLRQSAWPTANELWDFHQRPHLEDPTMAVVMARTDGPRTLSTTQVVSTPDGLVTMRYRDHQLGEERVRELRTAPWPQHAASA